MSVLTGYQSSFWYLAPGRVGHIEITPSVLAHFEAFQQQDPGDLEAGGQLFWEYGGEGHRRVTTITGPRPGDFRGRFRYKADYRQEQLEIDSLYEQGKFYLGDWHTHPEAIAEPSVVDIQTITKIYRSSKNPGSGLLMIIAGTDSIERSLSVSWCNHLVRRLDSQIAPDNPEIDETVPLPVIVQ